MYYQRKILLYRISLDLEGNILQILRALYFLSYVLLRFVQDAYYFVIVNFDCQSQKNFPIFHQPLKPLMGASLLNYMIFKVLAFLYCNE